MSNDGLELVAALVEQPRGDQRGRDPDRHVHEQHPLPAGPLGEHAAEQHAGRAARAGDGAPDAERLVALGALGEGRGDDRERGGGDQRGAEALHGARRDQHDVALGEPAGERREREQPHAVDEHAPPAEQVGQAAAEQQEAAEEERVGVHDPGQVVLGEVEGAPDRGQGHVHDRGVEHDHELGHGEQGEGEILGAGGVGWAHVRFLTKRNSGSGSRGKIRNDGSVCQVFALRSPPDGHDDARRRAPEPPAHPRCRSRGIHGAR